MFFDYDGPQKKHSQCNEQCPTTVDCCPQLPGTLVRINIPAGAVINLLNLIEISSPSGICLIVRIPLLGGSCGNTMSSVMDAIRKAGGSVEFVK